MFKLIYVAYEIILYLLLIFLLYVTIRKHNRFMNYKYEYNTNKYNITYTINS